MKHKDIAIAWLNGAQVEWWDGSKNRWLPLESAADSRTAPGFHDGSKYRIKPKVPEYRLYKYNTPDSAGGSICWRNTGHDPHDRFTAGVEHQVKQGTITWITPWIPLEDAKAS